LWPRLRAPEAGEDGIVPVGGRRVKGAQVAVDI
jgi:hypothetical protein